MATPPLTIAMLSNVVTENISVPSPQPTRKTATGMSA